MTGILADNDVEGYENQSDSLPAITLANPPRIMRDHVYAEAVAARLLEQLIAIVDLRGAGRLYVP